MNPYPPDMLLEEEEPAVQPPVTSPRSRHQSAPPPRRSSGGGGWMGKLTLLVSLLALIVSSVTLFLILRPEEKPEEPPDLSEEEPVTFRFGDRELTPLEGMPLNPYDKAGFSVDGKGRVTYEKDGRRARTGVDVSTYQKEIDWQAVAGDGIDFAMLRLGYRGYTEGGLFLDKTFERHRGVRHHLSHRLRLGAHHPRQQRPHRQPEQQHPCPVCRRLLRQNQGGGLSAGGVLQPEPGLPPLRPAGAHRV